MLLWADPSWYDLKSVEDSERIEPVVTLVLVLFLAGLFNSPEPLIVLLLPMEDFNDLIAFDGLRTLLLTFGILFVCGAEVDMLLRVVAEMID